MLWHVFALGCWHLLAGLHRVSPEGFQPKTGVDSMKDLPSAKRSVARTRRTGALLGECRDQVSAKRNALENARDFQEFARAVKKVVRPDHFVDLVDVFLKRTKLWYIVQNLRIPPLPDGPPCDFNSVYILIYIYIYVHKSYPSISTRKKQKHHMYPFSLSFGPCHRSTTRRSGSLAAHWGGKEEKT